MPLMSVKRLLLDTNVWLDYFMGTGPDLDAINHIIEQGALDRIVLMYAPTTAKDLFYLIPRRLRRQAPEGTPADVSYMQAAWACVRCMMELATAAPQSAAECELACMLSSRFADFEGNLILACAETAGVDYVVTADRAFLAAAPEACITPQRAVELMNVSRV